MRKAFFKTAVLFLCLYLTQCRDQGDPVVKVVAPPVDTAGVSKLVDTAYMLLKDTQVEEAMKKGLEIFNIYHNAHADYLAYRTINKLTLKTAEFDHLKPIYGLLDSTITKTEGKTTSDTTAAKFFSLKGYFFQKEGRFYEANNCYEIALQKLPQGPFTGYWLNILNNINQNFNSIGDYKKSEEYAYQTIQFIEKNVSRFPREKIIEEKTKALRALGWALYEQNKNEEALNNFKLALATTPNEKKGDILTFISKCHLNAQRNDSAFANAHEAIRMIQKFPRETNNKEADALHQLARCYLAAGNLKEAHRLFYQEWPVASNENGIHHQDFYKIPVYIGQIYAQMHQPDSALTMFDFAIQMNQPEGKTTSTNHSLDYNTLTPDYWILQALEGKTQIYYERTRSGPNQLAVAETLRCLDLTMSIKDRLFDIFETDISKNELQSNSLPLYEIGIDLSLSSGDTAKAAFYLQSAKAALLREKINRAEALKSIPDSLMSLHKSLKQEIAEIQGALQRNEPVSQKTLLDRQMQYDRLEYQIKSVSEAYAKICAASTYASVDTLQQALPAQTAILDFFYGKKKVYILVICKDKTRLFTINNPEKLEESIQNLRNTLNITSKAGAETDFMNASRLCYQNLLESPLQFIQQSDPGVDRLWIIPDGPLHYLPFNTLLTADVNRWMGAQMPFLIKKYAVGYAFTAKQFFEEYQPQMQLSAYGGWGISYDSITLSTIGPANQQTKFLRDFGPLPNATKEIISCSNLFGGTTWLNTNAVRDNFVRNANKFRILHLAMHAIADETAPVQSRLVFSVGPHEAKNHHFLFTSDIYGLTISSDLIVLSACNTANGALERGEGIASIGRAFQFAGGHSVLMTQWSIDDNTASLILPDFFQLLKQGLPKDQALQQAQLAMLERSPLLTPANWAGFVISGQMQPIDLPESHTLPTTLFIGFILLAAGFYFFRRHKKQTF